MDTLKKIAEDLLLTTGRLRIGELEINGPGEDGVRGCEVLVHVAERIAYLIGVEPTELWRPDSLADLMDEPKD